ncbi:MAG: hypothetical protein MK294_09670, partial [Rhodospirillales bacterium]|nr:hypothetical protein [Rhodospirillales bacterium]
MLIYKELGIKSFLILEHWDGFVTNQDFKYGNLKIKGAPSAASHVTKEPKNTVFLARRRNIGTFDGALFPQRFYLSEYRDRAPVAGL